LNRCLPAPVTFDDSGKILVKNNSTITLVGSDKTTIDGKILNNAFKLYDIYIEVRKYRVELTQDVENSQSFICVFLLLAMILSFVWIVAMRFIAVYMVWLSIAVILALFCIFTFVFWKNYFHYKGSDEVTYLPWIDSAKEIKTEIVFLIGGLLFGVILCILNVVVLCLCRTITLSVDMIECASKVVTKMWLTLLWPVVPFLLHIANIAYAASAAAYMASVERRDKMDLNSSNIVVDFKESLADTMNCKDIDVSEANKIGCDLSSTAGNLKVIMLFIFFMYLWLKNFVCGLNQLTLAGVFASYYWTLDKTTLPKYTLLKSFYRCFRYHCGSLAFGSFLITFVQFFTALLNLVKSNIENSTNQLAKFVIRCLLCCFKLHDMFLQFINKRAYIMMAIEGKNFCLSAKRALSIMLNNFVKSLVLAKVTDFLLIISKLIITSMIGVLAYFYIQKKIPLTIVTVPELHFYFIPLFVILIGTYSITGVFFDVYGTAVDTIFLCFLDDIEKNDGSNARPHFMDEHLESIFKGKSFQRRLTISYEKPENFKDSDTRKKSFASSASV
ncbi:choline transporter-like protein 2, partial [Biomphalaria pfeifferi]